MNAYSMGGTIRATFNSAAELAKRHDVEVVSVYRRRDKPLLPLDPAVPLRALSDQRPGRVTGRWREWAAEQPSRLMHPDDIRYQNFNVLTDAELLRFLVSLDEGVVIGTRPSINLAIARFAPPSLVRIGQDHMDLGSYAPGLPAAMARHYPRLDAAAVLTERTVEDYRRLLRGKTRVERIPNGVPDPGHRAALDSRIVVTAGRLTPQKGFDRLIETWAKVAPRHPGWELRIFGGGGNRRDQLEGMIDELGVRDSARLMGQTPRLAEELAAASIYVMSSRFEGFPMVLLEAMSVGLPAVSFDCPTGPRDIIGHGIDGYIVPDGDRDALAAAMGELMDDEPRRRSFGAAAAEKAREYSTASVAEQWEALAEELMVAKRWRGHGRRAVAAGVRRSRAAVRSRSWRRPVNAGLVRLTGRRLVKTKRTGADSSRPPRLARYQLVKAQRSDDGSSRPEDARQTTGR